MERVRIARRAIGDDAFLMLDAERLWEDVRTAVRAIRCLEEFEPYWIESLASLNKVGSYAQIRAAVDTPIAAGGQENTRWGFLEFIRQDAIDILQPDATVVGGVFEWLKVAHIADGFDLKVSPHAKWDIHCHLAAATPNALFVEYFDPSQEVKVVDKILSEPIAPVDGYITPPDRTGFGMSFDEQKIEQFRVS